jgi:hypothetical protein
VTQARTVIQNVSKMGLIWEWISYDLPSPNHFTPFGRVSLDRANSWSWDSHSQGIITTY